MKILRSFSALTRFERALWLASVIVVTASFLLAGQFDILTLIASLIGVTALIFVARGDVLGQVLTIIFSLIYAVISLKFRYFGEMITYVGMTAPIAALSVVSWLKNPYEKGKNQVKVAKLSKKQLFSIALLSIGVTAVFYFILKYFNTANLFVSTISVTTSFLASYLTFCRSPLYALAYAANDVILIVLWTLATIKNPAYLPMVICFTMFFANDIYGFLSWKKMGERQKNPSFAPADTMVAEISD